MRSKILRCKDHSAKESLYLLFLAANTGWLKAMAPRAAAPARVLLRSRVIESFVMLIEKLIVQEICTLNRIYRQVFLYCKNTAIISRLCGIVLFFGSKRQDKLQVIFKYLESSTLFIFRGI